MMMATASNDDRLLDEHIIVISGVAYMARAYRDYIMYARGELVNQMFSYRPQDVWFIRPLPAVSVHDADWTVGDYLPLAEHRERLALLITLPLSR